LYGTNNNYSDKKEDKKEIANSWVKGESYDQIIDRILDA